jgi:hypothetical protein
MLTAPAAWAQSAATFGIATEIAHVVAASEFDTSNSDSTWLFVEFFDEAGGAIQRGSVEPTSWRAGLRLPAGAVVTRLELAGCDLDVFGELTFAVFRSKLPPGTGAEALASRSTGVANVPGCGRFGVTPTAPPLVIDNDNATYWIAVTTNKTTFDSARVYYTLQVSPAPASATFGDVPTSHPFFQFVEALVASGITVGCGGGLYCPDAPLTRGQMAVFLSKALGLHFAP